MLLRDDELTMSNRKRPTILLGKRISRTGKHIKGENDEVGNRNENLPLPVEEKNEENANVSNQKKWEFFVKDDTSSSGSSLPVDLDLVDGEIEIVQRDRILSDVDEITPGIAMHTIKITDRDTKRMGRCSVRTDWSLELESSFLRGSQLLIRKVSTGLTFSHHYDNQGAFDRVAVRAHVTANNGGATYDGYFCRRQKIGRNGLISSINPVYSTDPTATSAIPPDPLAKTFRQDWNSRSEKTLLKKWAFPNTQMPERGLSEQENAGGDTLKPTVEGHPFYTPRNETPPRGNANIPSKEFLGSQQFSTENNDVPEETRKGMKTVNEGLSAQARTNHRTNQKAPENLGGKPKDIFSNLKTVPKAVLDVNNFDDFLANKKVIDYLKSLEEGDGMIKMRHENNEEINPEEVSSLDSAKTAILREYGYDVPETIRQGRRRRKTQNPVGDNPTSSESDVSDGELKSEVIKRAMEGRDFSGLLGLLENTKEWKESVRGDRTTDDQMGKIEGKINS